MRFENSVNSAGNETQDLCITQNTVFENSVNSAGNETETGEVVRNYCLRTLLILQVMKLGGMGGMLGVV